MHVQESTAPKASSGEDKLIGIELLRFASAIAVLIFHYQHFAFVGLTQRNFEPTRQPFYSWLKLFYTDGFYGVQVFWCISGFIFFWKYGTIISQQLVSGYKFFILRLSRLYPLHVATLLFVTFLQLIYFHREGTYFIYPNNDPFHFVLQLFMASNWSPGFGDSFNGPIWSISIEVLVYFLFFLSLRYVSASPVFLFTLALLGALARILKISEHPVFTCVMFFYTGCLTAVLYANIVKMPLRRTLMTIAALVSIGAILGLQFFITVKPVYFLLVLSPALILLFVLYMPNNARLSGMLTAAGNMTYSSYLLHVPIQISAVTIAGYAHWTIPIYSAWFLIAFLGATLLLSYYCFTHFEMPMQNLVRRRLKQLRNPEARRLVQPETDLAPHEQLPSQIAVRNKRHQQ